MWVARAIVDSRLVRHVVRSMARLLETLGESPQDAGGPPYLQDVERPSHIAFAQLQEGGFSVWCHGDTFFFNHFVDLLLHFLDCKRAKAETRTARLYGRNNFVHVIAYDAKPDVLGILLDN